MLALYLGVALILVALAAWVIAARPRECENRLLCAVLLLLAGMMVAFGHWREVGRFDGYLRLIFYYELTAFFLLLVLLDRMFLPQPVTALRRGTLMVVGAACLGVVGTMALGSAGLIDPAIGWTWANVAYGILHPSTHAAAVLLAARAAASPDRTLMQRRQAALVALAFGLLVAHLGGMRMTSLYFWTAYRPGFAPHWDLLLGTVVALVVPLNAQRIGAGFTQRGQTFSFTLLAVATVSGIYDAYLMANDVLGFLGTSTRPFWLAAFALALAGAIVRFGWAGHVVDVRQKLAMATTYALIVSVYVFGLATAYVSMGTASILFMSGMAVAVPITLIDVPGLKLPPRWMRWIAPPAGDPYIRGERLQLYTSRLREAAGHGWALDVDHPRWRRLRDELGVSTRDHDGIVAALGRSGIFPRVLLGRYLVEAEIGRGGSGVVHLAHDTLVGRAVAIKEVHVPGRDAARMLRELRALSRVSHPRVLTLYSAERVGAHVLLVLEHVPGGTLAQRLRREGRLPPEAAIGIALQVLDALTAVHAAGLIHRDVKPENVLFDASGNVKLADFGAAQLTEDVDTTLTLDLAATPSAMAPEQVLGESVSVQTDVYAVSALLYRLLTGTHYIDLAGPAHTAWNRILRDAPHLPHPHIPPSVGGILARGLSKAPSARWASAADMARVLQDRSSLLEHEA